MAHQPALPQPPVSRLLLPGEGEVSPSGSRRAKPAGCLWVGLGDQCAQRAWIAETIGFNAWTALVKKADDSTRKY